MDGRQKGIVGIVVSSLLFGSMGVLVRLVGVEVPVFSQVLIRVIVAFCILAIVFLPKPRDFFRVGKMDLLYYAVGGVFGYGLMLLLFTISVLETSIANAFFLLFTEPIFVGVLAHFFLEEKASKALVVSAPLGFLGVVFVFGPASAGWNLSGNLYGLGAGFLYAVYILVGRQMGRKYGSAKNTLWTFIFALLFLIPATFLFEAPAGLVISSKIWFLLFLFGAVNAGAYLLLNYGLAEIKAGYAGVLLLLEPVSSVFYALLLFSEFPGLNTIIGSFLIMAGVAYLTLSEPIE